MPNKAAKAKPKPKPAAAARLDWPLSEDALAQLDCFPGQWQWHDRVAFLFGARP